MGQVFFEPGASFSNHLTIAVSGTGVIVASVTYYNPSNITAVLSVASDATAGARALTVTNPDGQSATSASSLLTVVLQTNHPPVLAAIANRTLHALTTLIVTNSATDQDLPAQMLTFGLAPGGPSGVTIGAATGILSWTPTESQIGSNNITVRVIDDGQPNLSDAKAFAVTVLPRPLLQATHTTGNVLTLNWSAAAGTAYRLLSTTNLANPTWTLLLPDVVAAGPSVSVVVTNSSPMTFYRVAVIP